MFKGVQADTLPELARQLGLDERPLALFVGSWHGPNLQALDRVQLHLSGASSHLLGKATSIELLAEELRLGQNALSEITGEFTSDDLLGVIFSRFCIGK